MAKSLNKVQLIGNLGQDPEIKYTTNGQAVCNMSIACSESWKDKNTGEVQEKTEWIRLVAWRKLAEICGEYLHKGSKIYVEGKFTTETYEKDGQTHYATKVIINDMLMLDGKGSGGSGSGSKGASGSSGSEQQQAPAGQDGFDDFDDDIPF